MTNGYDNNNQISEWTRISNKHIGNNRVELSKPNQSTDGLMTLYEYDAFDRLTRIEQGKDIIENAYTADGKKHSRTTNGEVTYYVYDGNVVIEEQNSENEESARNVYGRNLITRETDVNKIVYGFNGHGDVVYYANLANIVLVVYEYDEFGNIISAENVFFNVSTLLPGLAPGYSSDGSSSDFYPITEIDNPYRYAGYEYIKEIGIYDLNARYYNPEIARFLSADPYYNLGNRVIGLYEINVPDAWSIIQANDIYVYCGNNPTVRTDDGGEFWGVVALAVVVVVTLTSCESKSMEEFAKEARLAGNYVVYGSNAKSSTKLTNQMNQRGWSTASINDLVSNPYTTRSSYNKATGNSATAYYDGDGNYVVIDDVTHAVIQVSDKNDPDWIPDASIENPYLP